MSLDSSLLSSLRRWLPTMRIPVPMPSSGGSSPSWSAGAGYFTAVAPRALAAAKPAGGDPQMRIPGKSPVGNGGAILSLDLTRARAASARVYA
jgi:hypothetical protein